MNTHQAVMAYSQSEKLKAALIWANQLVGQAVGFKDPQKQVAAVMLATLLGMIANEAALAKRITGDDSWQDIAKSIDMATVMVESGVIHEATYHLTKALSRTTSIAQRAMVSLHDAGVLEK